MHEACFGIHFLSDGIYEYLKDVLPSNKTEEQRLREILNALKAHQGEELKNVGESDGNNVGRNVGVNVGVNVGRNEQKILTLIDNSPRVSMKDLAPPILDISWIFL